MSHRRFFYKHSFHHVYNRAIDRRHIFNTPDLKNIFKRIILNKVREYNMSIYAYCIMNNHFHFIVMNNGRISDFFRDIESIYALFYNRKMERKGHLFGERFHSPPIETGTYLRRGIIYVLNNPAEAGIESNPFHYQWSSINEYFSSLSDSLITDTRSVERIFKTKNNLRNMITYYSTAKLDQIFDRPDSFIGNDDFKNDVIIKSNIRLEYRSTPDVRRRYEDKQNNIEQIKRYISHFEELNRINISHMKFNNKWEKRIRYKLLIYLREEMGMKYNEIKKIDVFHDLSYNSLPSLYKRAKIILREI